MPQPLIDITSLLSHLESKHLILTPNSRLKNKLIQAYNEHQQKNGAAQWAQPRVHSVRDWLMLQYDQLLASGSLTTPRALASNQQLQQIWRSVIDAHTDGLEFINPLRLSSDAQSAYATLARWRLDPADIAAENSQQAQFLQWAVQFEEELSTRSLCTAEQLQAAVNGALSDALLPREASVLLVDFDEITPLLQHTFSLLCDSIQHHSSQVTKSDNCTVIELTDKEQEIIQAALWAKERLASNPEASIGIIVPNLGQERNLLARYLTEVFEPQYILPETPRYTLPFNFSTGIPLGSAPIISAALAIIKLNYRNWDIHQLTEFLHLPFLGETTDLDFTEQLCGSLLRRGRQQVTTAQLREACERLADKTGKPYGQWLSKVLQQLEDMRRRTLSRQQASGWAHFFAEQMTVLGWPGARRLDSNEFQQVQHLYGALEAFARLDELGSALSQHEAIDQLSQLLSSTPFQAQTPESPIQVLGALEGAGLLFNHCWVMGMNHREWPPAPQPNPLLPLNVQRENAMPHADAERELRYAEALTEGYKKSASEVIFSYAKHGDETHQQASPLLRDMPVITKGDALSTPLDQYAQRHTRQSQEWYDIQTAPPLDPLEKKNLTGGSQLLRNQAINPMAAFLIHRLGARQPTALTLGFTPQQRGQMLHEALSNLWTQWQTQTAFLALDDSEVATLVHQAIDQQAKNLQRREPHILSDQYVAMEVDRLSGLIMLWLDQERIRPGFTVRATEQAMKTTIGGLPLTLRLDRLDQLDSGEWMIIDYKTGVPHLKSLGSDRPEEPQLPIYAIAFEQDVQALVFVQINANETTAKGIGSLTDYHEGIVDAARGSQFGLPDDWEHTQAHWRNSLENLASEFLNGEVQPHFKSSNAERFYDYLQPILRTGSIKRGPLS